MRRSIVGRLLAAGLATAMLASCVSQEGAGGTTGSSANTRYETGVVGQQGEAGAPVRGGTLSVAAYAEPRSLDPTKTYAHGSNGGEAMLAVYDTLLRYDVAKQKLEPRLAESVVSDSANTKWTINLRQGVEFSDGTALDSEAVAGSFDYYLENNGFRSQHVKSTLKGIDTPDSSTVVVRLEEAWANFDQLLAGGLGMVVAPASYAGGAGKFEPIGAGAFTLEKYAPAEELVLKARQDYWDGAPYLDKLRFVFLKDDDAREDALKSGAVEATWLRNPEVVKSLYDEGQPGVLSVGGLGNMAQINTREGRPGADPKVRQAIVAAIDPEQISERVHGGTALATKGIFGRESRWYGQGVAPKYDPARARKLVKEAKQNGFDGTIEYASLPDHGARSESLAVKAMLDRVGFQTEIDFVNSVADMVKKVYQDRDFDVAKGAASISEESPFVGLHSVLGAKSPLNATGYSNPELEDLFGELKAAADPEQTKTIIADIEKVLAEDGPFANFASTATFTPWARNVHGVQSAAETMLDYSKAWMAE